MAPTYQLSNITNYSTNESIPIPIFGLQDAMNMKFDESAALKDHSLFPDGCVQKDGSRNCTASCSYAEQIFVSLDTLHNCVEWPSIWLADEDDSLTPFAADLTKSLGLEKGNKSSTLPSLISNNIQNCLISACATDTDCNTAANKRYPDGFQKHFQTNLDGGVYFGMNKSLTYFDPCPYIKAPVTADVAGVGVMIHQRSDIEDMLISLRFSSRTQCKWPLY